MAVKLERQVVRWLQELKVPVSLSYIEQKIRTHHDYPSLLSITDTLDEMGIDNAAIKIDKEKLKDVPTPFMAHISSKGGEFVLVQNVEKIAKEYPAFEKSWKGIVLLAEKPEGWKLEENEAFIVKAKGKRQQLLIAITSIALLATASLWQQLSVLNIGLMITSITGLAVAILIVQHEMGISNDLAEKLCSTGKNTDCDTVIKSKKSKLSKWFNWTDAGIVYFSFLFLVLTFSFFAAAPSSFIAIFSLLAASSVPFIFFSVYYQWRVAKKWCLLCLATVTILLIQFILLLPTIQNFVQVGFKHFSSNTLLPVAFAFTSVAFTWLQIIKSLLQRNKELTTNWFSLSRFKNNSDIFKALLQQQRKIDATPFKYDLQLGNSNAPVQIVVACNPYCGPCAKTHEELHRLIENADAGLTVRFTIKTVNKEDRKLQAVQYILQLLHDKSTAYKRRVLHDWYLLMDIERFKQVYPLPTAIDIKEQLKAHEQWTNKSDIEFTPTIFVNGYELPKQYKAFELMRLVKHLEGELKSKNELIQI